MTDECNEVISQACEDGFRFSAVNATDVVMAVAHFSTQARGSDGILHLVMARALPFLAPYLAQVINASLKYECAKFWNKLPNRIRDIHSLGGFKSALFKHLIQNDFL